MAPAQICRFLRSLTGNSYLYLGYYHACKRFFLKIVNKKEVNNGTNIEHGFRSILKAFNTRI